MTHPDRDQYESAPQGARRDGSAQLRLVAIWLAVGLVIGAVVGGIVGSSRATSYQAVTAISSLPDDAVASGVGSNSDNTSSDDVSAFIQGELVVLNGAQLRGEVQRTLHLRQLPAVSASQVGMTDVIDVTATAPTRTKALRIATATGLAYKTRRDSQLSGDINSALSLLDRQLASVRKSLTGTGSTSSSTTALRSQEASLLGQISSLQLSDAAEARAVQIIQPADISTAGLSHTATGGLAGAILGAIIALLLLLVGRQLRPRIRSYGDIQEVSERVLVPSIPLSRGRSGKRRATTAARLLASRLTGIDDQPTSIVVLGATRGVGTSFVAAALAEQLADSKPVLLIEASRAVVHSRRETPPSVASLSDLGNRAVSEAALRSIVSSLDADAQSGYQTLDCGPVSRQSVRSLNAAVKGGLVEMAVKSGWTVVIDAPSLDTSTLGVDLVGQSDGGVLVVARGISRQSDVATALEILDARRVRMFGVLLNSVRLRRPGVAGHPNSDSSSSRSGPSTPPRGSDPVVLPDEPAPAPKSKTVTPSVEAPSDSVDDHEPEAAGAAAKAMSTARRRKPAARRPRVSAQNSA